jgi:hypothetical protein
MLKHTRHTLAILTVWLFAAYLLPAQTATLAFDVVIVNGHIIDGTGSP